MRSLWVIYPDGRQVELVTTRGASPKQLKRVLLENVRASALKGDGARYEIRSEGPRHLSIDTWLDKTPKAKIIRFLKDRGYWVQGLHEGLSKDMIHYQLGRNGLLKRVEEELNNIRGLPIRFKVDMLKYGSWAGGGR